MIVILISLDCVRPDYLECYTDKNKTPFFKNASENGVVFTECISQASHTTTSHSSMFTGLYPFNHGVRWVSEAMIQGKMIQEVLKKEGYRTTGLIGGWTLTYNCFSKGFDEFITDYTVEDVSEGRHIFKPIEQLVDEAIQRIEDNKDTDQYIFIHSFDAHFTSRSDKEGKRKQRYKDRKRSESRM